MIKRNKHKKLGTGVFNRKTGHVFFVIGESPTEWGVKSMALRSEEWWSKMWVEGKNHLLARKMRKLFFDFGKVAVLW